ncbi:MAG TPA: hypothetical protein VLX30_16115 [Burkholderiales bacterium]|nr:hypothetical protein [Burkholderiales bacterium]
MKKLLSILIAAAFTAVSFQALAADEKKEEKTEMKAPKKAKTAKKHTKAKKVAKKKTEKQEPAKQ